MRRSVTTIGVLCSVLAVVALLVDLELSCPILSTILLPFAIIASAWNKRMVYLIICVLAMALLFSALYIQYRISAKRGDEIVECIEEYRRRSGRYPRQPDELEGGCLKEVPIAAFALFREVSFRYFADNERDTYFIFFSPFPLARVIYIVPEKAWLLSG